MRRRLAGVAAVAVAAVLAAFHAWLLALRIADGRLLEPAVALRWLASLVLLGALVTLRRAGVPLTRGRPAAVFWLGVLVVHFAATPIAERAVPVAELIVQGPALAAVLLLGLASAGAAGVRPPRTLPGSAVVPSRHTFGPRLGFVPALAARPPPA